MVWPALLACIPVHLLLSPNPKENTICFQGVCHKIFRPLISRLLQIRYEGQGRRGERGEVREVLRGMREERCGVWVRDEREEVRNEVGKVSDEEGEVSKQCRGIREDG